MVKAVAAARTEVAGEKVFVLFPADDRPVASRIADWREVSALVNAMGEAGGGVFELASETPGLKPERQREYFERLKNLSIE